MPRQTSIEPVPHSWNIAHWPKSVYPNSPARVRYLIRANKGALMHEGALARVGRELIVQLIVRDAGRKGGRYRAAGDDAAGTFQRTSVSAIGDAGVKSYDDQGRGLDPIIRLSIFLKPFGELIGTICLAAVAFFLGLYGISCRRLSSVFASFICGLAVAWAIS